MLDTPLPRRRPLSRATGLLIQWQEARARGPLYPVVWARNRIAWEIAEAPRDGFDRGRLAPFHNAEIEAASIAPSPPTRSSRGAGGWCSSARR